MYSTPSFSRDRLTQSRFMCIPTHPCYFEANPKRHVTSPWKWCFNCCLLIRCLWGEGDPSAQCGGGKVLLGRVISPVLAPTPQASPRQELARWSWSCGLSKHHEPSHGVYTHIHVCTHAPQNAKVSPHCLHRGATDSRRKTGKDRCSQKLGNEL